MYMPSVHAINRILIYEPVVTRGESVTFVGKELPLATSHRAGDVRKDSILWGMLFYMLLLVRRTVPVFFDTFLLYH